MIQWSGRNNTLNIKLQIEDFEKYAKNGTLLFKYIGMPLMNNCCF